MKNKLKYLISVSLKRKMMTKWFIVAQAILCILVVGIINIDSIISAFGGDFSEKTDIYVIDNTEKSYDIFNEALTLNAKNMYGEDSDTYEIKLYEEDLESAKELVTEEGGIIVEINPDPENVISVNLISKSTVDTYDFSLISSSISSVKMLVAIEEQGITQEEFNKIVSNVVIERQVIDSEATTEDENMEMIMSTVFPIFILPFFMLSLMLVQMIGAEVNDEKTTKAMEIIISNVSPKTHFLAKIISGNIFVISQALMLVVYAIIGLVIHKFVGAAGSFTEITNAVSSTIQTITSSSIGDKLIYIIPLTLVLMLLTFIAYSLVAGVLASMTTTTEDFQQVQTPIIIISLIGYYLATMAGMFKGALFIKIFSFIPFISAILSPSLLVLGQIGIAEILISIGIVIFVIFLLVRYGLRIYKVGLLNYSSSGMWKKIIKAAKK